MTHSHADEGGAGRAPSVCGCAGDDSLPVTVSPVIRGGVGGGDLGDPGEDGLQAASPRPISSNMRFGRFFASATCARPASDLSGA